MEWTKDKTLKLIDLLQLNASLWNPSLCDSRKSKQRRKEELLGISDILGISVFDVTKKIQHLRTQYNREAARESRTTADDPSYVYVSNWYAFEYLHFLKDPNKPYRIVQVSDNGDENRTTKSNVAYNYESKLDVLLSHSKVTDRNVSKPEVLTSASISTKDEYAVFAEYIANELRPLKDEKHFLIAKKKILDVIFEVKMGMIGENRIDQPCVGYTASQSEPTSMSSDKIYANNQPSINTIGDSLPPSHSQPSSAMNDIIIY
ncbi:unnamed protein product [Leptidea sinapis]|uniref:MADF domain-containing protein n=1 Tax=Leptidea sinapis TaxID=189913 RepID=A0A5E4R0A0_9NEOP|nr:unnamed protein product [Leptidea sinapis]